MNGFDWGLDLDRFGIFADLPLRARSEVARTIHMVQFEPDETLYKEGHKAYGLHMVAEGWVRLRRRTLHGRRYCVAVLGPGRIAGAGSSLSDRTHINTASAFGSCAVAFLDRGELLDAAERWPTLMVGLATMIGEDLGMQEARLGEAYHHSVRARLARMLVRVDEEGLVCPQELIGDLVGASSKRIGTHMAEFERQGLVHRAYRNGYYHVEVMDREALRSQAEMMPWSVKGMIA